MRLNSLGVFGTHWHRAATDATSRNARAVATRWAGVYGGIATAWVLLSDQAVYLAFDLEPVIARVHQLKSLAFVAITGGVLYLAVFRTARRMQAQHKLLQRQHAELGVVESRWRHLMHELEEAAWFTSLDGREVHYISDAVKRLYGREPREFVERPGLWRSVIHPDDLPQACEAAEQMLRTGSKDSEYRIRHTDGRWRWVRDRASLLRDAQGRAIGIGGVAEDITERRREHTALRQRELQLADIVDTALDAIITVDPFQHIVVFNRAAERVFRTDAPSAIGSPVQRFIKQPLQAAHRVQQERAKGQPPSASRIGLQRLQGQRADGETFVLEASISRLDTARGPVMTAVLRDTTEMSESEAARDAQAAAEAASRAKTEFLSRMSHELRTPLNAVLGFSQLLQSGGGVTLTTEQRAQVDYIHQAGWHLLALINDVLDVSKIESGQMEIQPEGVALSPLVEEVQRMCGTLAAEHGVTLESHVAGASALQVRGDRTRLRQVLLNLLSNGIKYNVRGGRVDLRAVVEDGMVRIEVQDTGLGMSPGQLQHVFEPFNRLGRERSAIQGTGIGMTLTRDLVHLMHGHIALDSELGRGTCVKLHLPHALHPPSSSRPSTDATPGLSLREAAEPLAEPPAAPPRIVTVAPELDRRTASPLVLYIEDNPVNALVVEELLATVEGIRFASAEDGASGIEQVRALRPALVLLDMRLPDMTGEAVLQALKRDKATCDVRVVALSASAMPDDVAAAREAGAMAYWTKPIDFQQFTVEVRQLLGLPAAVA